MAQRGGHQVAKDQPPAARVVQLRRHHEVLLAQRQELAAHLARQARPAYQRQDHGDEEVNPRDRPVERNGHRQGHPQRQARDRGENLDQTLDDQVHRAPEVAGETAQRHRQHEAHGHAHQPDAHRQPGGEYHPRQQVAALIVGAEQVQALLPGHPEQVHVPRDQVPQPVFVAAHQQAHAIAPVGLLLVVRAEGLGVALLLQAVDEGEADPALGVAQVHPHRRHQGRAHLPEVGIVRGDELGTQRHQVEQGDDDAAGQRGAVAPEVAPDELRLGETELDFAAGGRSHGQKAAMLSTAFSSGVSAAICCALMPRKWVLGGTAASSPQRRRSTGLMASRTSAGTRR